MKYFALLLFLAGCASSGKTGTPYTDSAEKFMAEGRMENALEVLKNGEEKKPKNTAILLTLAELYYRIELREEAKMRYEKVLKLEDSHISHLRLSVIYEREGRLEEARNQLIQYLKTGKNTAEEIRLMDIEEKMGNYDSALVYLEKMKPEMDEMKYREKKVFLFLGQGKVKEAFAAVQSGPDDFLKGFLFFLTDYTEKAEAIWKDLGTPESRIFMALLRKETKGEPYLIGKEEFEQPFLKKIAEILSAGKKSD
ncbi:MAG TPA: tetratricopeptide repeat protein [bacterium]|nr:tetratricopeptide repeat protein [bacterium]